LPLAETSQKFQIVEGMIGITTRVPGGGASIPSLKTAMKPARGISAKLRAGTSETPLPAKG
jgi:hypothetical protein